MAQPEAQTRVGELSPEDRDRLQKLETQVEFVIEKMGYMADSITEMSANVNTMTVTMTRHADSNHHIAERQDKLEDRTFGKGGLADDLHEVKIGSKVNTAQIVMLGAMALAIMGAIGTGIWTLLSFVSEYSEQQALLIQALERLQ